MGAVVFKGATESLLPGWPICVCHCVGVYMQPFIKSFGFPRILCSTSPHNLNIKGSSQEDSSDGSSSEILPHEIKPFLCFGVNKRNSRSKADGKRIVETEGRSEEGEESLKTRHGLRCGM